MSRGLDPFGTRSVGGHHASLVHCASLVVANGQTRARLATSDEYDRAIVAAYVANTGRFPESRHENYARADQFTYRAKNARGLRIIDAARG